MSEELKMPSFQTEEEEANWWYDNREAHSERFLKAYHEGRVQVIGMAGRLARARGIPLVDVSVEDVPAAHEFAKRRGMDVVNYLRLLMHEGLEREADHAGS